MVRFSRIAKSKLSTVKELVVIAKKDSRILNPIQFNVLAILFVLGFMPFAVAFVSNAGSSTQESWENSMQLHDENIALADDSLWLENGGSNLTSWYSTFNPPSNNDELDCAYITGGVCEGYYDDTGLQFNQPELYKGLLAQQSTYPYSAFYSNDYFDVRSVQASQSHFAPGHNNAYAGRSGNEIFSWHLSEKYNNEIDQGQTLDSLRYWMTSSTSYSCNVDIYEDITFEGEISFHYDNDTLTFSNFEYSKNTKFEYEMFDEVHGTWSDVCAIGFFVEFDLTGFETVQLHSFNGQSDWDNTSITLTLTNFVNTNSPDNFGSTMLPFAGADYWNLGVQHQEINPTEASFLIKSGTLVLGVITLVLGIASTPYWDPFKNFFRGSL